MTNAAGVNVVEVPAPACWDLVEWRDVLEDEPGLPPFFHPIWHRLWWEHFGDGEAFALVVRRGPRTLGVVPLYVSADERVLRFVGGVDLDGIDLTDYCGPVARSDALDPIAEAFLGWLQDSPLAWREFDGRCFLPALDFPGRLAARATAHGLACTVEPDEPVCVVDLPESWDEYLRRLDKRQRHELRRKRHRFARAFPSWRVRTSDPATLGRDLETFVALHRRARGRKATFMTPSVERFFGAVARAFAAGGVARLDLLEADGRALAATFGFRTGGTYALYNSAYDPQAAPFAPGIVLLAASIERSIEEGVRRFDLLRGAEEYKRDLGAVDRPLERARVSPLPAGRPDRPERSLAVR